MTMGFRTWHNEKEMRTHWDFWVDDEDLDRPIPESTKDMILRMNQSPLMSSQVCALVELVSAIERDLAREGLELEKAPCPTVPFEDIECIGIDRGFGPDQRLLSLKGLNLNGLNLKGLSFKVPPEVTSEIQQKSLECRTRLIDPSGSLACTIWGIRCHGRLDCPKFQPVSVMISLPGIMQRAGLNDRL